jgi:hypothetical protein
VYESTVDDVPAASRRPRRRPRSERDAACPTSARPLHLPLKDWRTCEGPNRVLESVSTEATSRQVLDRLGKRFGARGTPSRLFSGPAVRTAAVETPLTSSPT